MRNRHLDVKGLFSHSYASEVFKSRTQIVGFIEVGLLVVLSQKKNNFAVRI